MKETPIIFSGAMIRAILDGRKTQTRRVIKPQPTFCGEPLKYGPPAGLCPYGQPGDRLWVRETFRLAHKTIDTPKVIYREANPEVCGAPWKPSIFMPRWASRITLELTGVRVERVQDISERDADAEGTTCHYNCTEPTHEVDGIHRYNPVHDYQLVWDSINAKRDGGKYSWKANPWVWVLEFKKL